MAITFLRGLTATILRNLTSLKRDAKRLQRRSVEVFGTQYPLSVCQTALAVSRGYASLSEFEKLSARVGADRDAPFWTILSRNDYHEGLLEALYALELDTSTSGPVVFLGRPADALPVALVMLAEEMSQRKVPSLIMIETEAQTIQDCLIGDVAQRLGLGETLAGFRSLDLRDRKLPVSIDTEVRCWVNGIMNALPEEAAAELESSGWRAAIEHSIEANAHGRWNAEKGEGEVDAVSFKHVKHGVSAIAAGTHWPNWMQDDHLAFVEMEISRTPPRISDSLKESVMKIVNDLYSREFSDGRTAAQESQQRPYVVLFSRDDPASVVLAAAVHSYYAWRHIKARSIRPMLFFSDGGTPYVPRFLSYGAHTLVVNGLDMLPSASEEGEWFGYKGALKVTVSAQGIQFMGKRVRTGQTEQDVAAPSAEPDLGESLAAIGIPPEEIEQIIQENTASRIRGALALLVDEPSENGTARVQNPAAYFRKALERGWTNEPDALRTVHEAAAPPDHVVEEARELLVMLPWHVVEVFDAIRHKADFEKGSGWRETEEGIELSILMLRELGRAPSAILADLIENKLCVRSRRGQVLLTPAASALLKGAVTEVSVVAR